MKQKRPIQPLSLDDRSVIRFEENEIVCRLLDECPYNLNDIGLWDSSVEDRVQFYQLIGYSLSGFGDLNDVTDEDIRAAEIIYKTKENESKARIKALEERIEELEDIKTKCIDLLME